MENTIYKGTSLTLYNENRTTSHGKYDSFNFHMIKSEIDLDVHNVILCLPERESSKR